ncbi:MAG: YihY/virulence factor BrkB family protein [Gemmatimonadota bacterium]
MPELPQRRENAPTGRLTPRLFLALLWKAVRAWFADGASRYGAALAYYTLFALAPVLLLVIAIAGLWFGEEAVRGEIVSQISGLIGREGALAIQGILQRASEPREGVAATIAGSLTLIVAATGAFMELQAALNMIWRVKARTNSGFSLRKLLARRARSLGLVVSIGFLLMVSLAVSAAISALTNLIEPWTATWPAILTLINQVFSISISTVLFALLFMVLPDVHLRMRDVLVGALVTAVLFTVGQWLIGLYIGQSALASPFGAAGVLAVVLVWVYYSTQIVLLGAEFTYLYSTRGKPEPPPMAGAEKTSEKD